MSICLYQMNCSQAGPGGHRPIISTTQKIESGGSQVHGYPGKLCEKKSQQRWSCASVV